MRLNRLIPAAAVITLLTVTLGAAEPTVKIAVFDFELQDFSAAEAQTQSTPIQSRRRSLMVRGILP